MCSSLAVTQSTGTESEQAAFSFKHFKTQTCEGGIALDFSKYGRIPGTLCTPLQRRACGLSCVRKADEGPRPSTVQGVEVLCFTDRMQAP